MEGGKLDIQNIESKDKENLLGNKRFRKERAQEQKDKGIREEIEESKKLLVIRIDWNSRAIKRHPR